MKKEDLINLGITDNEVIRQIQIMNGKDREAERKKVLNENGCRKVREAVKSMVSLLRNEKSLRRVLNIASSCYYHETTNKPISVPEIEPEPEQPAEVIEAPEENKEPEQGEVPGENEVTEAIEDKDNIQQ